MKTEIKKQLKVLIIENNPVDRKVLLGMLSKPPFGAFSTETTDSLEDAFKRLTKDDFDVILLDLNLKDSNGMTTLERVHERFPELPVVVNTGAYQDDVGLKAVTRGAQDYLIKGKYKAYGLSKSLQYALERKKAERELKSAYNRIKETQSQLIQAEKMNVVGGLASGVAHEVKNPLATILYGIEFLNTKLNSKDEQVKLTLDSIKEATTRANQIIKDLLDFSSLSNLQIKPEDVNSVIDDALGLTKHQCDKSKIEVAREFGKNLPPVEIDKNRIEQVIIDVVLNAIFAMKQGGVLTIRTSFKKFSGEEGLAGLKDGIFEIGDAFVLVDVEDSGPGISEQNLSKIFDPFFTTRRAAGGVGLGLSIARTIMQNHNGSIDIGNLKGGGVRARLIFSSGKPPRKGADG